MPAEVGWVAFRDALVHYQLAARLDAKRVQLGLGIGEFAAKFDLDPSTFSAARMGRSNWSPRYVALAAELGGDALPNPAKMSYLIRIAKRTFLRRRAGLRDSTRPTVVPWPPGRKLDSIAFRTGYEPADNDHDRVRSTEDADGMEIHIGPPEREWTEEDQRDFDEVMDALRGPLTDFVQATRQQSPVLAPEARRHTPPFEIELNMRRITGDEWRQVQAEVSIEIMDEIMVASGFIHRVWPYAVLAGGWSVVGGHFIVDIAELEPSGQRRPTKVLALRGFNEGDECHWLVSWPADITWDDAGNARFSWDRDYLGGLNRWTPL